MLYIVATPIGNLMDFSYRAVEILKNADVIAAEDTRRAKILLNHYKITTKTISLHKYNEKETSGKLLNLLKQDNNIALISDAGTPLISDPGYYLVQEAHKANIAVSPIPGASSVIAAISVSGLPVDQFIFIGFLPSKLINKTSVLNKLKLETRTMVFFEAPTRILATLDLMKQIFGLNRQATFCRELTKKFETIKQNTLENIYNFITQDKIQQIKGEIVLVVSGNSEQSSEIDEQTQHILRCLLQELPPNKTASLTAKITGLPKNKLYNYIINHV